MASNIHHVIDQATLITPAANRTAANRAAKAWDPDTGGDRTFRVPLSADGTEPVSHYACHTPLTDAMRTAVLDAFANVPFVSIYYDSEGWDFAAAITDAGLQRLVLDETP